MEKKYILDNKQYIKLLKKINKYIHIDEYGEYTITNIYYDNDNYDLLRTSIDKPLYKEKLRIRSYEVPKTNDKVFFEIKKKYKGVVNKRRITLKLSDFYKSNYKNCDGQIVEEIKYMINTKKLKPKIYLAYDRNAYVSNNDEEFRITFDKNIRYRLDDLFLEKGDYGKNILDDNKIIMEVKNLGAMPGGRPGGR